MNVITNNDLHCTIALAALEQVIDPEIGLNIVELGLIYRIDFNDPAPGISILLTLTTPFCPMGDSITAGVEQVLRETFSTTGITVGLTFDPPWDHSRISEVGKEFLNR